MILEDLAKWLNLDVEKLKQELAKRGVELNKDEKTVRLATRQ